MVPESDANPASQLADGQLIEEIRGLRIAIEQQLAATRDWRLILRNGMLLGLGTILGTTILVSALIWLLRPLERFEELKPAIDSLSRKNKPSQ